MKQALDGQKPYEYCKFNFFLGPYENNKLCKFSNFPVLAR